MFWERRRIACAILFICLIFHNTHTDAACLFPMNSGTWLSSDKGSLPVTSTIINSYTTSSFGTQNYECYESEGSKYVARSSVFNVNGVDVRAYICFEIYRINDHQYYYYEGSVKDSSLSNERLKTVAETATVSVNDICDRTTYEPASYSVLVQDGLFSEAASTCSSSIQGEWTYTFTNSAGATSCSGDSGVDVCTDKSLVTFNYTACSTDIMYSAGGELGCLYSSSGTTYTYQHIINLDTTTDESTTYRISCLVLSTENNLRYITQYPNNCYDGQTSKSVSAPGASMVFTVTASCPYTEPESEKSYTAAIAVGVIVPLLLIIVIAICTYKMHQNYKHYQENKEVPTPKPDPKYANGEVRNKRLCKSNGVRIDEKTIIHDSHTPRSLEISIDEKMSRPESTATTGSVRRESSILLDIHPSTRGTMVAESLPEMDENGDYSSDFSDSDNEAPKKEVNFDRNDEFLGKDEETQTPDVPQIVIDSLTQTGDTPPDVVVTQPSLPAPTSMPSHQSDSTQTDPTKKKKIKRKKSAMKRVKSATSKSRPGSTRPGSRQKPDCYGNTDENLVFGTRITVLKMRPKSKSFRKKKQVNPLITEENIQSSTPTIKEEQETSRTNKTNNDNPRKRSENHQPETHQHVSQDEQTDNDGRHSDEKLIPDETKSINTSRTNLKKNESMLREKIYRVTNRDLSTSKRKKKLPKLRHPLEGKKSSLAEPTPESWFKHKGSSASKSRTNGENGKENESDGQVSPEVDEKGDLLPEDNTDIKRPPTQQKPFVNPKSETTEEIFDKIKTMWHFGNKWLGNTYIAQHPHNPHEK